MQLFTHNWWGRRDGFMPFQRVWIQSETQQPHPGFELGLQSPFPTMITIMPQPPPKSLSTIWWMNWLLSFMGVYSIISAKNSVKQKHKLCTRYDPPLIKNEKKKKEKKSITHWQKQIYLQKWIYQFL